MRILHTSDWHLGRSFHGVDLTEAQAGFVDHLLEVVRAEQVDLVVVSGDVYDRALPPVRAVQLADETFARLADTGVRTVVTSGNHDSAIRLGHNARLADSAGVHFRTRWQQVDVPVTVPDRHGEVHVYGIPYLEPDAVRQAWALPARTHEAALAAAMDRIGADRADAGWSLGGDGPRLRRGVGRGRRDDGQRQRARHLRRGALDRPDRALRASPTTSPSATCTRRTR